MSNRFLAGLDLGQAADYTALIVVEEVIPRSYDPADVRHFTVETYDLPDAPAWARRKETYSEPRLLRDGEFVDLPPDGKPHYLIRFIHRFKLGTSYPDIVQHVGALLRRPELGRDVTLIVDGTGVGRAVVDMVRLAGYPFPVVPVAITAGRNDSFEDGWYHVPKVDLVSSVQVLLQSKRLQYATALPEAPLLISELQNFDARKTPAANEVFEARSGAHDDLVLAVALATWYGERHGNIRIRWF